MKEVAKPEAPRDSWWSETLEDSWAGDHDDQHPPAIPMKTVVTKDGHQVDRDPLTPPSGEPSGHVDTARDSMVRGWWDQIDPE